MSNVIQLPQNLTIHHIEAHFNELNEKLSTIDSDITFDAGELETIDTSGLQTLMVCVTTIVNHDRNVKWENTPEILSTSAQKIGLEQALRL